VIAVIALVGAGCSSAPDTRAVDRPRVVAVSPSPTSRLFSAGPPRPSPTPSPTAAATIPPSKTTKGWGTPIFVDNFSGPSLNTAAWNVYDDPDGPNPRSTAAVSIQNGLLNLTGGFDAQGRDESGGVGSRLDQMYGRWEVRFRVDRGPGYSAVTLLWPELDGDWPRAGEIDFTEINRGARTTDNITIHKGADNNTVAGAAHADFTQWHTIAVEWLPGHVSFYLDGKRQSFLVTTTAGHRNMVPDTEPMHLALQFDQGCDSWFQCRDASTPAKVVMQIDWVKIYSAPR
jgi:hypothetical protein